MILAQVLRKAAASAVTLGSGASLGPEAPSVELGANTAAVLAPKQLSKRRQRMLVAAGAAAGVTAAFDAPVAGALFAIEFVLKSSRLGACVPPSPAPGQMLDGTAVARTSPCPRRQATVDALSLRLLNVLHTLCVCVCVCCIRRPRPALHLDRVCRRERGGRRRVLPPRPGPGANPRLRPLPE